MTGHFEVYFISFKMCPRSTHYNTKTNITTKLGVLHASTSMGILNSELAVTA
jgi:hypothetical protein